MAKKLLQINPVIRENTSTGKIMRELGDLAISCGWESYIAYSKARDGVPSHSSRLVPVGSKWDLAIHYLATRIFDAHGLASKRATRDLINEICKIDPDVVHIHNVHGYFLNYPILCDYLAKRGKPVVWTTHDCWLFTGHCYHYSSVGCMKWQSGCNHCPQKKAFPASYLFDRSERNFEDKKRYFCGITDLHLVAVSGWMKNEISRSFIKDKPCEVIHNGIDLDIFRPRDSKDVLDHYCISNKCEYVLGIASLWLNEKGLPDFIKLSYILEKGIGIVLVGKMDRHQKESLPESVVCIPRTEDAISLAALYSGALALVNPTWQDNYPTVNLEAIACGTPVICYDTGGCKETLGPDTGFVIRQGDVTGIVTALGVIKAKGRAFYKTVCRKYALANFSKADRFNDYIKLYNALTDNS